MNTLYCGDCLDVLRQFVPSENITFKKAGTDKKEVEQLTL
jgi:hypothetical protein